MRLFAEFINRTMRGVFSSFATINCRSFGNSFVHKMAHEDFFFVALSCNAHNPTNQTVVAAN